MIPLLIRKEIFDKNPVLDEANLFCCNKCNKKYMEELALKRQKFTVHKVNSSQSKRLSLRTMRS